MTASRESTRRRVTQTFAADHLTVQAGAHLEAIVDAEGAVCGWMLPDRVVGRHGATQAWLLDGRVYSFAGTHIGSLRAGVFRGTDGTISGRLSGSQDPAGLPGEGPIAAPPQVLAAQRPVLSPPSATSSAPRDEWSSYGWSGFLLPRPLLQSERVGRREERAAFSAAPS